MGRGAAKALESKFWTLVLSNPDSFFSSENGNLLSGAGTNLSSTNLASAVQKMLEMVDSDGTPVSVIPKFLVVPPALKAEADALYVARTLNVGGGSATADDRIPGENVHYGRYTPLVTPYLGTVAGLSGSSDSAFYLFGPKDDVAAFGIAYLNGVDKPTIEHNSNPHFNWLGMQIRGWMDFAVVAIDHRGCVMSEGTAAE